jgi:glyceraldehyde 3-phosphate dehydrogenase
LDTPQWELVAVNDIVPIENIVYLLKYDTVYGRYEKTVESNGENLILDGNLSATTIQRERSSPASLV